MTPQDRQRIVELLKMLKGFQLVIPEVRKTLEALIKASA